MMNIAIKKFFILFLLVVIVCINISYAYLENSSNITPSSQQLEKYDNFIEVINRVLDVKDNFAFLDGDITYEKIGIYYFDKKQFLNDILEYNVFDLYKGIFEKENLDISTYLRREKLKTTKLYKKLLREVKKGIKYIKNLYFIFKVESDFAKYNEERNYFKIPLGYFISSPYAKTVFLLKAVNIEDVKFYKLNGYPIGEYMVLRKSQSEDDKYPVFIIPKKYMKYKVNEGNYTFSKLLSEYITEGRMYNIRLKPKKKNDAFLIDENIKNLYFKFKIVPHITTYKIKYKSYTFYSESRYQWYDRIAKINAIPIKNLFLIVYKDEQILLNYKLSK